MKKLLMTAAVAGLTYALVTGSAAAVPLGLGDSVSVGWSIGIGEVDSGGNSNTTTADFTAQDITVEALFKVTGFRQSEGEVDLRVTVTNTTADMDNEVGVNKLGFGVDPDLTGLEGLFDASMTDEDRFLRMDIGTAPEFASSSLIDLLSETGNGAPRTLREGETDIFDLTLIFEISSLGATIDLNPFDIKIQTSDPSFELTTTGRQTDIPLPASLWLLGMGMIGLGLATRRRASAARR